MSAVPCLLSTQSFRGVRAPASLKLVRSIAQLETVSTFFPGRSRPGLIEALKQSEPVNDIDTAVFWIY